MHEAANCVSKEIKVKSENVVKIIVTSWALKEEINEFQIALSQAEAKELWVTMTQWVCKLYKHLFVIEVVGFYSAIHPGQVT